MLEAFEERLVETSPSDVLQPMCFHCTRQLRFYCRLGLSATTTHEQAWHICTFRARQQHSNVDEPVRNSPRDEMYTERRDPPANVSGSTGWLEVLLDLRSACSMVVGKCTSRLSGTSVHAVRKSFGSPSKFQFRSKYVHKTRVGHFSTQAVDENNSKA